MTFHLVDLVPNEENWLKTIILNENVIFTMYDFLITVLFNIHKIASNESCTLKTFFSIAGKDYNRLKPNAIVMCNNLATILHTRNLVRKLQCILL